MWVIMKSIHATGPLSRDPQGSAHPITSDARKTVDNSGPGHYFWDFHSARMVFFRGSLDFS